MSYGIDATNKLLQELIKRQEDTGWVEMPLSGYNVIWSVGTVRARRIGKIVTLTVYNIRTTQTVSNVVRVVNDLGQFTPKSDFAIPVTAMPSAGLQFGGLFVLRPSGILELSPSAVYTPSYGVYGHATYMID